MCRLPSCAQLLMILGLASVPAIGQASRSATVEGRVVNGNAPELKVRLVATGTSPLAQSDGYLGTVSSDGAFRFEDVAPGSYRLIAEGTQYLRGELGSSSPEERGTELEIKSGEHRTGLQLRLVPDPPAICGRVVDSEGRPVHATVETYTRIGTGDGTRTRAQEPSKVTGPDGRFVFENLWTEGQYFLRANGVWYPGSRRYADAQMLPPVQTSQSGCSTVIRIPREKCQARHIRGNIEGALAFPLFEYDVSLYEANDSGSLFLADSQPLYRADAFDFDAPCPGNFVAIVQDHWGGHWSAYASPEFAASEASTTVTLTPATQSQLQKLDELSADPLGHASIHGVFHLDGLDWEAACPAHVSEQIGLLREGAGNAVFSLVDPQGRFAFERLKPGRYSLRDAYFAHGAAYVASFRINGEEADDRMIELRSGQDVHVEITISANRAGAGGKLPAGSSSEHYLPPGTHPSAQLAGKLTGAWDQHGSVKLYAVRFNSLGSARYETTPSKNGSFRFGAVDPGIYVLETDAPDGTHIAYGAKGPNREGGPVTLLAGERRDGLVLDVPAGSPRERTSGGGPENSQPASNGPTYPVAGVVEGELDPAAGPVFVVRAVPREGPAYEGKYQQTIGGDRRFKIDGLTPGEYRLMVIGLHSLNDVVICSGEPCYALPEHVMATQTVVVGPETLSAPESVRLLVRSLATLEREILLDGKVRDAARMRAWAPSLTKEFRGQAPAVAKLSSDGHFSLSLLDEGDYSFVINGFWPEYYIRSVVLDGIPIEGRRFGLSNGKSVHLVVNLATDGAAGTLKQGPVQPPIDPYTDICRANSMNVTRQLLIPDPLPSDNSGIVEGIQPFLNGVPPGRYRAVSVSNFSFVTIGLFRGSDALYRSHEFLERLALLGTSVEITPREKFAITTPDRTEAAQQLLADMGVERTRD